MKYDYVIVGGGLSASVIARKLADNGKRILIVERRTQLGGNLYDEVDENGILVQRFGPHTFHTNNDIVVAFISKYAEFDSYNMRCETKLDGVITPSPFNFTTIDQFYSKEDAAKLKYKLERASPLGHGTIVELLESTDCDIQKYAQMLFDKDYALYTSKQWGISPREVDPSVLKRVPVEFSYSDRYFHDKFEGLPKGGFMSLIKNLLDSSNIETLVNEDALKHISFKENKVLYDNEMTNIIFTGQVDELFKYKYGKLPYRSLKFEYETHNTRSYQSSAIVAYPSHEYKFTRITEYTKLPFQKNDRTVIAKEYPLLFDSATDNEPYYPIPTKENDITYKKYKTEANKYDNLYLLGRLAEYKYYNMDQCVLNALDLALDLESNNY